MEYFDHYHDHGSGVGNSPRSQPLIPKAIGRDEKGIRSLYIYTAAIALAFVAEWIAATLYVVVAIMWLIPDSRIENSLTN